LWGEKLVVSKKLLHDRLKKSKTIGRRALEKLGKVDMQDVGAAVVGGETHLTKRTKKTKRDFQIGKRGPISLQRDEQQEAPQMMTEEPTQTNRLKTILTWKHGTS